MREKYCWLAGGWKLVLELGERKILLGWRLLELPNIVSYWPSLWKRRREERQVQDEDLMVNPQNLQGSVCHQLHGLRS